MLFQDPRLRVAFMLTVVLSALIFSISQVLDEDQAFPLVIGLVLLMSVLQMAVLFLWSGTPRTTLVAARRLYMLGEFDDARNMLESLRETNPSADVLALLGNTYRQLKQLARSEAVLQEAVKAEPDNKLALYGLGKTMLVQGQFAPAVTHIRAALENGGRKTIRADLAQALYYANATDEEVQAQARAAARVLNLEQYRTLFVNYLLYNLVPNEQAVAARIMQTNADGVSFWQSEARRFADTAYGRKVAGDVLAIKAILEEGAAANE